MTVEEDEEEEVAEAVEVGTALRNRNRPPLRTKLPRPRPRFSTHRRSLSPSLSSCFKKNKKNDDRHEASSFNDQLMASLKAFDLK